MPTIEEPLLRVKSELTTVVPAPLMAFSNVPLKFNLPVLFIVPPRFSTLEVNIPPLSTAPVI